MWIVTFEKQKRGIAALPLLSGVFVCVYVFNAINFSCMDRQCDVADVVMWHIVRKNVRKLTGPNISPSVHLLIKQSKGYFIL